MINEADTLSVNANGLYSIGYSSVNVGRHKGTLVGRHRYHYMLYVRLSGYTWCPGQKHAHALFNNCYAKHVIAKKGDIIRW